MQKHKSHGSKCRGQRENIHQQQRQTVRDGLEAVLNPDPARERALFGGDRLLAALFGIGRHRIVKQVRLKHSSTHARRAERRRAKIAAGGFGLVLHSWNSFWINACIFNGRTEHGSQFTFKFWMQIGGCRSWYSPNVQ